MTYICLRRIKRFSLTLSVLMIILFTMSVLYTYYVYWHGSRPGAFALSGGRVSICPGLPRHNGYPGDNVGITFLSRWVWLREGSSPWIFWRRPNSLPEQEVSAGLWWFILPIMVTTTALAIAQRRRVRSGACIKCGYDIGELIICPECGRQRDNDSRVKRTIRFIW